MKTIKIGSIFAVALLTANFARADVAICYQQECHSMVTYNQQQVMEQLKEIFSADKHALLFCESSTKNRKCLEKPISFSGRTRKVAINFQIPFARVSQIKPKDNSIEMILDYQIKANQYYPLCVAPQSSLDLIDTWGGALRLVSPDFKCRLTELGTTQMGLKFDVDYINLDQGVFGGTYKINVYGDAVAESSGYALFQLTDDRVVEMPRPVLGKVPTEGLAVNNPKPDLVVERKDSERSSKDSTSSTTSDSESKSWWESFKDKFLKILYLEPSDG